jgi:hypothetical protein
VVVDTNEKPNDADAFMCLLADTELFDE